MSRIGQKPIVLPQGVKVRVENDVVFVEGPKGKSKAVINKNVSVEMKNNTIYIASSNGALHGLSRSIIANMVKGVTEGFSKTLKMEGIGYRAKVSDAKLILQLGFSHDVEVEIPSGISINIDKQLKIEINGVDKQQVGDFAAKIRGLKPPEPYKGKGIKYINEYIRRKVGKAAATTVGKK